MVDYAFYLNTFLGDKIPVEAFDPIRNLANTYLRRFTYNKVVNATENVEEIKMCLCAMCDVIFDFNNSLREKKAEEIDGYSVTYVTERIDGQDSNKFLEHKLYRVASVYLDDTGLLYWGA